MQAVTRCLRNRFVVLLIVAIVTVVGLATFAASRALRPPGPETTMEVVAHQVHFLTGLVQRNRHDAIALGTDSRTQPAQGN